MKQSTWKQRGTAQLAIIVAIVAVVAVGCLGWWVFVKGKDSKSDLSQTVKDAIKNAKCAYDDKDLCKFFTGWKAQDNFTMTANTKEGEQTSTTVITNDGKNKYHLKAEGSGTTYEIIGIDNTTYTKAADGTWWKQTVPQEEINKYRDVSEPAFAEPGTEGSKVTYKNLGKETCGELSCFKYEMVDATNEPTTTTYLWFDDKDYQLRRSQTISGSQAIDAVFTYNNTTISEPSPVKELAPGQYLLPGQSEPTILPNTGDTPSPEELEQLQQ